MEEDLSSISHLCGVNIIQKIKNDILMISTPKFRRLRSKTDLQEFSNHYCHASGLPIPKSYLQNPINYVFGIYLNKQLIGGFILGNSTAFRTLDFFASKRNQPTIQQQLGQLEAYTEICCFFIDREFRTNTRFNFFVWLTMTYALKRYGKKYFLFGTCSRSLARLYAKTPKSIPIHEDFIDGKATFIFKARRNKCVHGMLEIMAYKFRRRLKLIKQKRNLSSI